ncbi:MAG TPA: hypothetical protein VE801_13230 [Xanthobacteraceae bacterium]|nr:hypothetical protein [Xanthobacteraceae bacterium]
MYSNLRFVICASLVGCAGLIGVLALLPPTLEDRLLASEQLSDPPAPACNQQNWWHFDRNCLSRRGMPWEASSPASDAVESRSSAESTPEQPSDTRVSVLTQSDTSTGSPQSEASTGSAQSEASTGSAQSEASTASAQFETSAQSETSTQLSAAAEKLAQPSEPTAPSEVSASRQEAGTSIAEEPRLATQQSEVSAPQQASAPPVAGERPVAKQRNVTRPGHAARPVATERRVAKPVVESQPSAAKKTTREARGAKPSNEALNAVRKFQDNLRDIPVSSYAADGTQRTIVIRPTSIQDVYYYSAPR